jgi:raffinose/stachyose/melibiose transport system substrate-binding protein
MQSRREQGETMRSAAARWLLGKDDDARTGIGRRRLFVPTVACLVAAVAIASCGGSSSSGGGGPSGGGGGGHATLTWWNNATSGSLQTTWNQVAKDFHAMHPNVVVKNVPIQNEELQNTKEPAALQSGNPPEVFQQWGGGRQASEVPSGLLMNLTTATKPWIGQLGSRVSAWQTNGQQYGVPYDLHVVGFWYRKDLFAKAGISSPPQTLTALEADAAKLKSAGIAPIALGSKDGWPDAFWYEYFALRECSTATLQQAMKTVSLKDPCFAKAGQALQAFIKTSPFESGFLGIASQQGAGSSAGLLGNGKAAMELQGDWEPGTIEPLTTDHKILNKLGWFPFPTIPGGAGQPGATLGGGDGFSCSSKASKYCAQFLQYIDSVPVQKKVAAAAVGLPANPAASSAITTPGLKTAVAYEKKTPYLQTYFDVAFPVNVGTALDTSIANFFAGQGGPQGIAQAVSQAAAK